MKAKLFLIGLLFLVCTTIAFAQSTPKVDNKEKNQTKRIVHGVKNGELTKGETKKLAQQQVNIRRTERKAKRDGKVTRRERRNIRRKQAKANANIYVKKHNRKSRN